MKIVDFKRQFTDTMQEVNDASSSASLIKTWESFKQLAELQIEGCIDDFMFEAGVTTNNSQEFCVHFVRHIDGKQDKQPVNTEAYCLFLFESNSELNSIDLRIETVILQENRSTQSRTEQLEAFFNDVESQKSLWSTISKYKPKAAFIEVWY